MDNRNFHIKLIKYLEIISSSWLGLVIYFVGWLKIGEQQYKSDAEICSLDECYADLFLQYFMEEKWFLHFFYVEGGEKRHHPPYKIEIWNMENKISLNPRLEFEQSYFDMELLVIRQAFLLNVCEVDIWRLIPFTLQSRGVINILDIKPLQV